MIGIIVFLAVVVVVMAVERISAAREYTRRRNLCVIFRAENDRLRELYFGTISKDGDEE